MVNVHITDGEEYKNAVYEIQKIMQEHGFTIVEALGVLSVVEFEINEQRYNTDE